MKILNANDPQLDSFKKMAASSDRTFRKKKDRLEFDFFLEEFLKEEAREGDEYPVLLPRYGRFWDNGYEDVE